MKQWIIDRIDALTMRIAGWFGRDMNLMRAMMWVAGVGMLLAIMASVFLIGMAIVAVWGWML